MADKPFFVDDVAVGIWLTERDGRVRAVNTVGSAMLGYARGELTGRTLAEVTHRDDLDDGGGEWSEGEIRVGRRRMFHRDRRTLVIEGRARRRSDGVIVTIVYDVTALVRAEEALAASEREQRVLVELAPSGIARANLDGSFTFVNRRMCEITGYSEEELLARTSLEITHPADRAADRAIIDRCLAGPSLRWTSEKRYVTRSGEVRWVLVNGSLVKDGEGNVTSMVATVLDITDRKAMEDELRRAAHEKDAFLAMLSHELRNPLAPVRHALAVIAEMPSESEAARGALATLGRQVGHLSRLVDDLLDVTRISHGKIDLRRERVDMAALVAATLSDHATLFAGAGVALGGEVPPGPVWLDGDPTRLSQIVGNVLHNAVKFTPRGGHVDVCARVDGARLILRVRDDGAGIEPMVLARLFEPFVQGEDSLDRRLGGLGLGLALARRLVELHGGSIGARSEGPGHGTELTITLPLAEAPSLPAPAPAPARPVAARLEPPPAAEPTVARVLVVEDNADAAEMLQILLELDGHSVDVAHDGHAAVALVRSGRPDVVLCDLGLPGLDGFEVARALRADPDPAVRETPLIALTGYARPEDRARATAAGFTRHLSKPADPEAVRRLIRELAAARCATLP